MDLLIERRERLSVVPIYNTPNAVDFGVDRIFPLSKEALKQELRTVNGYEFSSPPWIIIEKLLCIMIDKEIGNYRGERCLEDVLNGKRMRRQSDFVR